MNVTRSKAITMRCPMGDLCEADHCMAWQWDGEVRQAVHVHVKFLNPPPPPPPGWKRVLPEDEDNDTGHTMDVQPMEEAIANRTGHCGVASARECFA